MLRALDVSRRRLYAALLADFAVFGIVITVIGASLPTIITSFGWSYIVMGLVLAAGSVGYFVSTFLCGFLVRRVAPKLIMITGLLAGGACLALFGRSPSPVVNILLYLVVGLSHGGIEIVTNLEVIGMEAKGQSRLMNLMHAAFSVGAVLGPAMVGIITGIGASGLTAFPIAGLVMAAMAVVLMFIEFPRGPVGTEAREHAGARVLAQPLLLIFVLLLFVYVGAELGVSNWVSEYFVKELGSSIAMGAYSVSFFWFGLLAGRVGVSYGYRGTRQQVLLLILSLASAAALAAFVFARSVPMGLVLMVLTGAGFSAVFPLVMALVGKHLKSSVAVGAASTGGGIGSFTIPFVVAALFQALGLRGGFGIYAGMSLVMTVLSVVVIRLIEKREKTAHAAAGPP